MRVRYLKRFENRFRRLPQADKKAAKEAIEAFLDHPLTDSLGNRASQGTMTGKRSIFVDHDLRIVFSVKGDYEEVLFIDIGTHADVYRK